MEDNKSIAIILYKFSVVVKGIERNLKDLGYLVDMVTDDFDHAKSIVDRTVLFIVYLPDDIMEDLHKQRKLTDLCASIKEGNRSLMIIGEQRYHQELIALLPELRGFTWFDRPVDNDLLGKTVEKIFKNGPATYEKKRILIVDDDPSYAGMVREWIKDIYKVDIVTAGMQAITFLLKNKVDLVLLDYEMPIVDGPQVLQMLRQEEATKHIPVVFLTGVGTREEVARVMALKPDGYILKSTPRDKIIGYLDEKLC